MSEQRLAWRIVQSGCVIERFFIIGAAGRGTGPPSDDPVCVVPGGRLVRTEPGEQACKHLLGCIVEIDAGGFGNEADDNIGVIHPEVKRSVRGARLVLRKRELIGGEFEAGRYQRLGLQRGILDRQRLRRGGKIRRENHRQRRQGHENPEHGDDHEAALAGWRTGTIPRHSVPPCAGRPALVSPDLVSPCVFAGTFCLSLSSHLPSGRMQSLGAWT